MESVAPVLGVVLCGGTSRRMGSVDKTAAAFAGSTVLDHLLDRLPAEWDVVCVGPARATRRSVRWACESPPGSGPVAGIAAAVVTARPAVCVVAGGDMPFAAPALAELAERLLAAPAETLSCIGVDGEGRAQPLLAAYRTSVLRRLLPADPTDPAQARLMALVRRASALPHVLVACDARAVLDVDTPEELSRARSMVEP